MLKRCVTLAAIAVVWTVQGVAAQGQPGAEDERQAVQFLVGTWNCAHRVGGFSGTYTTTFTSALGDRWLKQTQEFPATKDEAPVHTEYFWGYDPRILEWVRFGSHSNGQYYGMVGKRAQDVWSWSYVLPGRNGSAVWTKKSAVEYTIDGPTYPEGGKMVTEHHTCRKSM